MNTKHNIAPERLEQLKTMINSRAQKKVIVAQTIAQNEDQATNEFNTEVFNHIELFDALIDFTVNNYTLFEDLELLYDGHLRNGGDKKEQLFGSITSVMALSKVIASKQDFILEKKFEYEALANELEKIIDF